ncbi:MAG: hypothetical protein JNM79_06000 [Burkholderiales bacterium]|nr:hypothetical protein [Burkholderiales bacterium]
MANGTTHRIAAAVVIGAVWIHAEADQPEKSAKPLLGAGLAALLTNLPDILEPALHPNHRQFFHSLTFAAMLGKATHEIYEWETDNPADEAIRFLLLVGAGAYFVHLLLDAGTAKSLPILGRF